jgi:multiple sugar transport system permease protein
MERKDHSRKRVLFIAVAVILGAIYFVFSLFPILWTLLMSLKNQADVFTYPPKFFFVPTLANYAEVLLGYNSNSGQVLYQTSDFLGYFKNSLIISTLAVAVSLLVGVPAAYAMARLRFSEKVKNNLLFTYLSFRFLPELAILIPLYTLFQKLHLTNTYGGLIWVYQLIGIPFVILIMRDYFEEIPISLEQAAQIDRYPWLGIFTKVVLPLAMPGIAAAGILAFIFCWNNFIFGLVLGGPSTTPVTVSALNYVASEKAALGQAAAASMVSILPQIALSFFIQRFLVRGLTLGAVKG